MYKLKDKKLAIVCISLLIILLPMLSMFAIDINNDNNHVGLDKLSASATSLIAINYYDNEVLGDSNVAIKVDVNKSVAREYGIEPSNILEYFDDILGLFDASKDPDSRPRHTVLRSNQSDIDSTTLYLNEYVPTMITLDDRRFKPFVVEYSYVVDGFLQDFVHKYNSTKIDDNTGNITNNVKDMATIINQGYVDNTIQILPLQAQLTNSVKRLNIPTDAIDALIRGTMIDFYLSRAVTITGDTKQVILGHDKYAHWDTTIGESDSSISFVAIKANPIGYSIAVLLIGIGLVVGLRIIFRDKKQ